MKPGIYAVTGANGSGKSTLFSVIMSCDTNKKSINLDQSISIDKTASINMPSSDIVEISQNFYWPLFTIPVDWIYQIHLAADVSDDMKRDQMITRVEEALQSLNFYQEIQSDYGSETLNAPTNSPINLLRSDLTEKKEDWFGDLSGGQKSKVELVRKVSRLNLIIFGVLLTWDILRKNDFLFIILILYAVIPNFTEYQLINLM